MSRNNNELPPITKIAHDRAASHEVQIDEPFYPILSLDELPEIRDHRDELSIEVRKHLQPHQQVVHIHRPEIIYPSKRYSALETCMKAARVLTAEEMGSNGPTVASVNLNENSERSRYEAQHGRDDEQAAEDLDPIAPKLIDATILSLAETQGVENEPNVPGKPFRQEEEGSIILLNLPPGDTLGEKFKRRAFWDYPRYTSVDAPGTFINLMALKHARDTSYLLRSNYDARDGQTYPYTKAFERSDQWAMRRTDESHDGLMEYKHHKHGGMRNQGWRDSDSAIVHADGTWANSEQGVAPIEVQGIYFDAFRNSAQIYRELYKDESAQKMAEDRDERAWNLQKQVVEKGYVEDSRGGYFISGWDRDDNGRLRPLKVRTSAMGRLLTSNILKSDSADVQEMVRQTLRTLTSPEMLTRWGIRTLSSEEKAYIPFVYHVGPSWPHDTNESAKGASNHGYYGIDRIIGATPTNLHNHTGLWLEHASGYDDEEPHFPTRDTYVYDPVYDSLSLFEQVPPFGQTWAASTEVAKQIRYQRIPLHATDPVKFKFEKEIWRDLPLHIKRVVALQNPELAKSLSA